MKIVFALVVLFNITSHACASSYHAGKPSDDPIIFSTAVDVKNDTHTLVAQQTNIDTVPSNQLWDVVSGEDGLQALENYLVLPHANHNREDHKGRSLLEMVAYLGGESGERIATLLIKNGADITHIDKKGHHALYMASSQGHEPIVILLLAKLSLHPSRISPIINYADHQGLTSLHLASSKGHDSIVKRLLVQNATVDQTEALGRTALHLTCYKGHESTARILIGYGADVLRTSHAGLTARQYTLIGALNTSTNQKMLLDCLRNSELTAQQNHDKEGRERLKEYKNVKMFYETFNNKMAGIFLAYKVLYTGLITRNKDTFTLSKAINLLGNAIPLPGANIVGTILSSGVESYEEAHEVKTYIKPFATFFSTTTEMENTVERNAYELTCRYEKQIKALTFKGAEDLAACGIGRFIKHVRDRPLTKEMVSDFSFYVTQGIATNTAHQGILPWMDVVIETHDQTLNWTDLFIYQESMRHHPETTSRVDPFDTRIPYPIPITMQPSHREDVSNIDKSTKRKSKCLIQ